MRVTIDDPPPTLLALGMTATVRFTAGGPKVAVLPAGALTDKGGQPAVWVLDPVSQHAQLRRVQIAGYGADGSVAIGSGLAAGELVVTAGTGAIDPGMALTVWQGATR